MASTFAGHELYSRKALKCLPAQLAFLGAFSTDISGEVLAEPSKSVDVPLIEMDRSVENAPRNASCAGRHFRAFLE